MQDKKFFYEKESFVYVGLSIPMDRYGNGSSIPNYWSCSFGRRQ